MIKRSKEENDIKKEGLELAELRKKKKENELIISEIERLNAICYQLHESIKYETNKRDTLKDEIEFKRKSLNNLVDQHKAISAKCSPSSKKPIIEMKIGVIREQLEGLLTKKIPEIKTEKNANPFEGPSEFQNLVHDHIVVYYTQYDQPHSSSKKEERQVFRISSKTKFHSLLKIACQYWDLQNMSDYILTDETEAIMCEGDAIINDYMKLYSVRFNTLRLLHIPLLKGRTKLVGVQEGRIKEYNSFESEDIKQKEGNIYVNPDSTQKIREFSQEYPGLRPFNLIDEKKVEEKKVTAYIQAKNPETSCIMMLLIFIFFSFTLWFIYQPIRDITRNNLKINYAKYLFNNTHVASFYDLYDFLVEKIGFAFIGETDNYNPIVWDEPGFSYLSDAKRLFYGKDWFQVKYDSVKKKNQLEVGPLMNYIKQFRESEINFRLMSSIHVIIPRVVLSNCSQNPVVEDFIERDFQCVCEYYEFDCIQRDDLTINDIYKKDDSTLLQRWISQISKFQSPKESNIQAEFSTNSGEFDGSGYHLDIKVNEAKYNTLSTIFSITEYMKTLAKLIPIRRSFYLPSNQTSSDPRDYLSTYFFVDKHVKSIQLFFSLYYPQEDIWMSCFVAFNIPASGKMLPYKMKFQLFHPNIYYSTSLIVADIIRLVIAVFMLPLSVYMIFSSRGEDEKKVDRFLSLRIVVNALMLILFLYSFVLKLLYCFNDEAPFFNSNGERYIDSYSLSERYNQVYNVECLLYTVVSIKMLQFLKLNESVSLFFTTIDVGMRIFIKYSIFIIVILFGYACIAYILWGPHISYFATIGKSFLQVLLLTMGYFDPNSLITYSPVWTVILVTSFFLFILFFMFSIFIAVYVETVRKTLIKQGYPDDKEPVKWTGKDYLVWIFNCLNYEKKKDENN